MEDTDDSADESADDSLRLRVQLQVQMAARNLMDGGLEELGNLRCKSFPNPAAAPTLATAGSIHVVSHEVYRALSLVQRELDQLEPGALHAWGDRLVDRDKPKGEPCMQSVTHPERMQEQKCAVVNGQQCGGGCLSCLRCLCASLP